MKRTKKLTRIAALILGFLMVTAVYTGCAAEVGEPALPSMTENPEPTAAMQEVSLTVTDMKGREITLTEPAERVVALTAADCEILCAIGARDALVGRGEFCDWPESVLEVPSVQSGYETNIEQIIALQPQVVVMSTMDQTEEQVSALEKAGISVVVSEAHDIEGVYAAIEMMGALMGKNAEAAAVIDDMRAEFEDVVRKAAGKNGGSVYFEVSPLEWGLWTAGRNTFMDEISSMIGIENVFSDVEGWATISEEQVLARNPDNILTVTMFYGEGPEPTEEILGRDGWQEITAVKNGTVFGVYTDEMTRPGPRLADAAKTLYGFIYGE